MLPCSPRWPSPIRLGYDDLAGTLANGMLAWHKAGHWPDLTVVLGGFAGWASLTRPLEREARAYAPSP